jgi:triosephosphate isomerase (TIM)
MRTKIVAGNWKMNTDLQTAKELVTEIKGMVKDEVMGAVEIMVFPPFPFITNVAALLRDTAIKTGAQNISEHNNGAYTGEVSASMLTSLGLSVTLIGHSERREYFGDTHPILTEKVNRALENNMQVIFCCGETLEQRNSGAHFQVVKSQLVASLFHISAVQMEQTVIAYEPVWAIGTGFTASSDQAQEMHAYIRKCLTEQFGPAVADKVRILYGGSVKPDNAAELFGCADIDGGLIGGAALSSRSFTDIVKAAAQ